MSTKAIDRFITRMILRKLWVPAAMNTIAAFLPLLLQ